jgi:ATP-dependent Clp protease protease subunit
MLKSNKNQSINYDMIDSLLSNNNYREIDTECFENRILMLNEDVNSESVEDIVKSIIYYNKMDDKKLDSDRINNPITLIINSDGGDVYSGIMLSNIIMNSKTPINTYCYSKAFSIAFIIFICGTNRYLHENAMLMYHQITVEEVYATLQGLEEEVEYCKKLNQIINNIVKLNTKITDKQLSKYKSTKKDWFISASDNEKLSITDYIIHSF